MSRIVRAYYADWVRGPNGDSAGLASMDSNIRHGIMRCAYLRKVTGWRIYCPHEHEDVVKWGYNAGEVKAEQIIKMCCDIVELSEVVILGGDPEHSAGMRAELETATGCQSIAWSAYKLFEFHKLTDPLLKSMVEADMEVIEDKLKIRWESTDGKEEKDNCCRQEAKERTSKQCNCSQ